MGGDSLREARMGWCDGGMCGKAGWVEKYMTTKKKHTTEREEEQTPAMMPSERGYLWVVVFFLFSFQQLFPVLRRV